MFQLLRTAFTGSALCMLLPLSAQEVLQDRTFSPTVHTVQLFKKGFELAPPILDLNNAELLVLRFDDLQANTEYLSYTVVHCDAQWRPSDLSPAQYLSGAPTDVMPPPANSFNTLEPFLQYEVEFPNRFMRPTRSGNYILKVFRGSDQEDVVLQRRFLVFEHKLQIDARVQATRDVDRRDNDQQIELTVRHPGFDIRDPFGDVHVVILQNMRWDDARTDFKPRFIRNNELIYDHPPAGLFRGGNEWRFFDMKNIRYATPQIAHIDRPDDGIYHVSLKPEERREYRVYLETPDINGKHLVRNDLMDGDPLGADYLLVDFFLPCPEPVNGEVYVYGAISDMQCGPEFLCSYDQKRRGYTLTAFLKQGFVNYAYAVLPRGASVPDLSLLEGSHYQTENDYLVLVYVTDHQMRFDRLVGMRFLNSRRG